jgi:hypothetical protein
VKNLWLMTCFMGLAVFVTVESPRAYAQSEVDPDHYETRDLEPQAQSRTNASASVAQIHYEGNFVLPYNLQCNQSSLPPGKYRIAIDSEEATVRVTVSRRGRITRIEGLTKRPSPNHRRNALVVQRNGASNQLAVIQVAQLDLFLSPTLSLTGAEDGNLMELPLVLADSRR